MISSSSSPVGLGFALVASRVTPKSVMILLQRCSASSSDLGESGSAERGVEGGKSEARGAMEAVCRYFSSVKEEVF